MDLGGGQQAVRKRKKKFFLFLEEIGENRREKKAVRNRGSKVYKRKMK